MNGFQRNQGRGAKWETKSAALSGEFGMSLFRRKFGDLEAKCVSVKCEGYEQIGFYNSTAKFGMTNAQKIEARAKALAYQETLTKTGTVRKTVAA